jgi:hypothetical protein
VNLEELVTEQGEVALEITVDNNGEAQITRYSTNHDRGYDKEELKGLYLKAWIDTEPVNEKEKAPIMTLRRRRRRRLQRLLPRSLVKILIRLTRGKLERLEEKGVNHQDQSVYMPARSINQWIRKCDQY